MQPACRAYIDIETTGLNPRYSELTVVGICLEQANGQELVQLYEQALTPERILAALAPADRLYSYNGKKFDLPFIAARLGLDLAQRFAHCDLMYDCWRHNLWGGQKAVETRLGIGRVTAGMDGADAARLWHAYRRGRDPQALRTLLQYNAEDITNLAHIRRRLRVR